MFLFEGSSGNLGIELAGAVQLLDIRVSSNVVSTNEDIGDGALASLLLEGVLDVATVGNLVQLEAEELHALRLEQLLGGASVGAVRLGVDDDFVGGDGRVDLGDESFGHCVCAISCGC